MRGHDSSLNSHRRGHWGKIYHICHIMEPLSVLLGFKRDPPYLWSSRLWSIQVIGTDDCCWRDSQLQKTSYISLSIVMHFSKFLRRLLTATIPKYVKKKMQITENNRSLPPAVYQSLPKPLWWKERERYRDGQVLQLQYEEWLCWQVETHFSVSTCFQFWLCFETW